MTGARKMTAAEYLTARGWVQSVGEDLEWWADSRVSCSASDSDIAGDDGWWATSDAVAIQRARDAEEERKAWVAFAAQAYANMRGIDPAWAASVGDDMLAEYRARFAVEVEP